eukprot:TRINITY_DN3467_c0_g1_i4.p1 TRINITY_DN3467_c0_g1~~TRINITY_DN3467_c0_g1_i4.p1  ORF type:complete len:316 (-),score=79.74 TRINITY_DN3467_c0_g1_i4:227-1174(-)
MRSIMLLVLVTLLSAFFTNSFALVLDESSDDFDVAIRAIDFIVSIRGEPEMVAPMVEIEDGDLEEVPETLPSPGPEQEPMIPSTPEPVAISPTLEEVAPEVEPVIVPPMVSPTTDIEEMAPEIEPVVEPTEIEEMAPEIEPVVEPTIVTPMVPPTTEIEEMAPEIEPVVEVPEPVDAAPVPEPEEEGTGPVPRAQTEIEPALSERCQDAYDDCVVRCGSPELMDFNCQDTGLVIQRSCSCQNVPGASIPQLPENVCPLSRCLAARDCCNNPGEECDLGLFRGVYDFSGYCDNDGDGEATNAVYTPRSFGSSCYCP